MDPRRIVRAGPTVLIKLALDTNILVYAESVGRDERDEPKVGRALRLVGLMRKRLQFPVIAFQTLAELHQVLVRKHHLSRTETQARTQKWRAFAELVPTDEIVFTAALELASGHQFPIYDAIILAAAVESRSDLLLSEDMQDGFAWRGVTVANPFAAKLEPRLERLFA